MSATKTRVEQNIALSDGSIDSFPWGRVVEIHRISGLYDIVEFDRNRPDNAEDGWEGGVSFHPYVEGEDLHHSYGSLDEAIIAAIVYRNEAKRDRGAAMNEKLTHYIMRILDPEDEV